MDLEQARRFVACARKVRASGFRVEDLDYLLRDVARAPSGAAPTLDGIDVVLDQIERALAKVLADTLLPSASPADPTGELTLASLCTLLPAEKAAIRARPGERHVHPLGSRAGGVSRGSGRRGGEARIEEALALPAEQRVEHVLRWALDRTRALQGKGVVEEALASALKLEVATVDTLLTVVLSTALEPSRRAIDDFMPPSNEEHAAYLATTDQERALDDTTRRARRRATYRKLHKASLLVGKLQLTSRELEWLFVDHPPAGWLDLNALPAGPRAPARRSSRRGSACSIS